MRKGRSSRRSRTSRPLVGVGGKSPSSASDLALVDAGVPTITVGIHPSEPPSSREKGVAIVEARGPGGGDLSRTRTIVDPLVALEALEKPLTIPPHTSPTHQGGGESESERGAPDASQTSAPPTNAAKAGGDAKKDFAKTIAFGDPVLLPDARTEPAPTVVPKMDDVEAGKTDKQTALRSTIALGSLSEEAPPPKAEDERSDAKALASTIAFGSAADVTAAPDVAPPGATSEAEAAPADPELDDGPAPKIDTAAKSKSKSKGKAKGGSKDSDKRGVGRKTELGGIGLRDEADSEVHEQFFSEGDLARHLDVPDALDSSDALTVQDKVKRKADPEVVERRARFVRYVKVAVAGASFLCLVAAVREALVEKPQADAVTQTTSPQPIVKAADPAVGARPAPSAVASVRDPAANGAPGEGESHPPPSENVPASASASAPTVAASEAAASASPGVSAGASGSAKDEKEKARVALERGKAADAIEAGERAVAIDPTDGESWLILGAAYQEKGDMVGARRAYSSCVKEGKTGPRSECAKMLR